MMLQRYNVAMLHSDWFGLDWSDELDVRINSGVSPWTKPSLVESCWRSSILVRLTMCS